MSTASRTLAEWVLNRTGKQITPDQERCLATLCSVERIYNLVGRLQGKEDKDKFTWLHSWGLVVKLRYELATFDADELTRLVKAAHENCVRVAISPSSHMYIEVMLSARDPEATRMFDRHPTWQEVNQ